MQNGRAHVGKLAQFAVGEALDAGGVFHHARVGHEKTGNVRPVLVQFSPGGACHQRAGDVAAAARKGAHAAIRESAVKAGDDGALVLFQFLSKHAVGPLGGENALLVKAHHIRRVDEIPTQIVRQQHAVQVFAAAGGKVRRAHALDGGACVFEQRHDVHRQTQLAGDAQIAFLNFGKGLGAVLALFHLLVAAVEKVGHLVVAVKAPPRGAGHGEAPLFVRQKDVFRLLKAARVRKRRTAEFANDGAVHVLVVLQLCSWDIIIAGDGGTRQQSAG